MNAKETKALILEAARLKRVTLQDIYEDSGEWTVVLNESDAQVVNAMLEYISEEGFDGEVVDNATLLIWPSD